MKYSSLVFDLDGTLSDPALGIFRCMNYALEKHGLPARSIEEIIPFIGPPLEVGISKLSGSNDEGYIKQLMATYRQRYGELGYAENQLYEGITELLGELQNRRTPMGICTSKYKRYAVKVLEHLGLLDYFQFISGPEYGERKGQQLAQLIAAGHIDGQALMIGDRAVDLIAAKENDLRSCAVLWGHGELSELEPEQPTHLIRHPSDLLQFV